MSLPHIIKKIDQAGLLGRGCGTFPTATKWQLFFNTKSHNKYVICNCAESEPGVFKDKFILDNYPAKVIDGIKIALDTFKATKGFIYLNPKYYNSLANKLRILIGDDNIEIYSNPSKRYIGGEETAVVNLMEGKREETRLRPPFITQVGLFSQPTLVNNCETFYSVALINEGNYKQEKFFCVSGDNTPDNVFIFPEKITVEQALLDSGHYPEFPFFVQIGGAMSGTCLRSDQIDDIPIQHYSSLIIHKLNKNEHELILNWLEFFKEESCGQCVPCREGTYRLFEMYQAGNYDQNLFADIIFTMQNSSLCSLGKMAVNAITSYYANIKKDPISNWHHELKICSQ